MLQYRPTMQKEELQAEQGDKAELQGEPQGEQGDGFVFQTMLTCIGNKRKLVGHIQGIADEVRALLRKD